MSNTFTHRNRLVLFARWPAPGRVKRRLAEKIGPEAASALYTAFLEDLLEETASVAADRVVAVEPPEAKERFRERFGGIPTVGQAGHDLGERMSRCVRDSIATYRRVCIIGTDLPDLGRGTIESAFTALSHFDLVLGPALDGGYYLVGLRGEAPIFEDIDWSTDRVLAQTLKRASDSGRSVHLLRPRGDIDTFDDLQAAARRWIRSGPPRTRAVMRRILPRSFSEVES